MKLIDGRPVFSATDLVGFLACEHLTALDRAALAGLVRRPIRNDPEIDLIAKRGDAHERRYLEDLRAAGRQVTAIDKDGSGTDAGADLRAAADQTLAAMRRGDEVIYQATFFDGTWRGHADFLHRVPVGSALGGWSYEVADTKLARKPKAGAVLQLCVYSDLLAAVQGHEPDWMEVALGGSARAIERFRVDDYRAYYRRVRARFEQVAIHGEAATYPPVGSYPEPVEHCEICKWGAVCGPRRRADDHLSLVSGISRKQRAGLTERGITTLEQLAAAPLPFVPPIDGSSKGAMERVREQARLQAEGRRADKVLFELLSPIEAGRGLALMPRPSRGDLFFDIEGDPFVEEGGADGLEYLFGVIEPGDGLGLEPDFHAFWGTDRAGEKRAFEAFIDLVMDRLARDPDLHVYHYGAYEPSAVKRLMGRHATREEEVDRLLRGDVFVDLFSVVKQGLRVSQESYSIKKLEPLYGLVREVALQEAGSSILNFELWLDGGRVEQPLLDLIQDYNRDDCVSNWRLREWLEERRAQLEVEGRPVPRPGPQDGAPPPNVSEQQAEVEALAARLMADVPPESQRTPEQQATWLLAQLLDWHRREDKAHWWQYFHDREIPEEELIEESSGIGGLEYEGEHDRVAKSIIHRYRFPPQDHDIRKSTAVEDRATGKSPGEVMDVDQRTSTLLLKRGAASTAPHPRSIIPADHFRTTEQRAALIRLGAWVAEHGIDAPHPDFRAERDLLLRRPPRVGQPAGDLIGVGESELEAARRLVLALDRSCLAIQGPPGAGKTFTGARMIVELVGAGKKVGITATSHKVIGKLLDDVCAAALAADVPISAIQRASEEQRCQAPIVSLARNNDDVVAALATGTQVAAGTSWVWSDDKLTGAVDVLFIDEAGQISLANVLAVAQAAGSIVLLGDPQQLEQPLQGWHPPGAEASALQHLLGGERTMPKERGLFLEHTWRLHPDLARFTSDAFYEGRLGSSPVTFGQALEGNLRLNGTGVRWVDVPHVGNQNESAEEVAVVAELAESLQGTHWVDETGESRRITWQDLLIVAPYNAQVARLAQRLPPEARVGTVDKFQGQEAAVVFYSMTTSSPDLAPRGMEFLYSLNRLNVATSRARCLAVIVASPALLDVAARTPRQMRLANALCLAAVAAGDQLRVTRSIA